MLTQKNVNFKPCVQESLGFEPLSFRSWLEKMHNAAEGKEANFAGSVSCQPDFLLFISFPKISTVCLGCVVFNWPPGVSESQLRPSNLTTLISIDGGAEWQKVAGPGKTTEDILSRAAIRY